MPASTVGYTLLPIPPRIRIVPRSTNSFTPNAAYPIALCGRILASALSHMKPTLQNTPCTKRSPTATKTPRYFIDSHHPFTPKGALLKTISETLGNHQFSQIIEALAKPSDKGVSYVCLRMNSAQANCTFCSLIQYEPFAQRFNLPTLFFCKANLTVRAEPSTTTRFPVRC